MKDFRDLQVWQKAHHLTIEAYRATGTFPKHELYGMTTQIHRCASSVVEVKRMLASLIGKVKSERLAS